MCERGGEAGGGGQGVREGGGLGMWELHEGEGDVAAGSTCHIALQHAH